MLGAAEHRSDAYSKYSERGAEAATTQMACMGAEDPPSVPEGSRRDLRVSARGHAYDDADLSDRALQGRGHGERPSYRASDHLRQPLGDARPAHGACLCSA